MATPALADPLVLTPLIDAQLRFEHVEQAPLTKDANAVTLRLRSGIEAKRGDFALIAESEASLAIDPSYNSGLNGKTAFPMVSDPQTIELNRLQLQYRGLRDTIVTVGRQVINLDDQRFVSAAAWRNNEQTYDAVRVEWSGVANLKADVSFVNKINTIWGINGGNRFGPARLGHIGGDTVLANLGYTTRFGTLSGFAYLIDQDRAPVFAGSNQTYGARFVGAYPLSKAVTLTYLASYAAQSDYHRSPNRYHADYYAGEVGVLVSALSLTAGYEGLGADRGGAATGFQTPLAALHKFNGWADKFLVTPPNGLRDAYGSIGYGWKQVAGLDTIALTAVYHRFDSDRVDQHYGDEVDAQVSVRKGRYTALVKYADYRADRFATDTKKVWLSLNWVY
ncbi:alginate export family protein [Sphingomonas sp. RB3P16]|uniref:alginate export family protein n=1 Tax=Parasphingomonas frigoris TaxID=3096163 RepID=UPI002FCBA966